MQTKAKAKQEPGADAPPPPPGFSTYKKNEGAGGVLSMMEGIITDAKAPSTCFRRFPRFLGSVEFPTIPGCPGSRFFDFGKGWNVRVIPGRCGTFNIWLPTVRS